MKTEFRNTIRRRTDGSADVIDCMTEAFVGKLLDISASGLRIASASPFGIEALFQWQFPLPDTLHTDTPETIECGVQVIWSRADPSGRHIIGARFIQIAPQTRERIRHWCNQATQ